MTMRHGFSRWINLPMAAVFGGAAVSVLLACWLAPLSVQLAVLGLLLAAVLAILLSRSLESAPQGTDADRPTCVAPECSCGRAVNSRKVGMST